MLNDTSLSYSSQDGSFVFFNSTPTPQGNVSDSTAIIAYPRKERENDGLSKDDLYLIIVVEDATQASVYRAMIKSAVVTAENLKDTVAVYYYSPELGTFNFRNSKLKQKHNI